MAAEPIFPGGTFVSHLRVYDWPTSDAPGGSGSPHFHTTSTEAYVVLGGRGRVETLGPEGFASHELTPGRIVWFSPGVVHRAVNDGGLEVLVVMSNAGLPESGDAVLTFPREVLASADAYREAATLPRPTPAPEAASRRPGPRGLHDTPAGPAGSVGRTGSASPAAAVDPDGPHGADRPHGAGGTVDDMVEDPVVARAARVRRDLALEGYAQWRAAVESDGPQALEPLYQAASHLVTGRADVWRDLWTTTVARAASDTDRALDLLAGAGVGDRGAPAPPSDGAPDARTGPTSVVDHLMRGAVAATDARPGARRYGMCGRLRTWPTR